MQNRQSHNAPPVTSYSEKSFVLATSVFRTLDVLVLEEAALRQEMKNKLTISLQNSVCSQSEALKTLPTPNPVPI